MAGLSSLLRQALAEIAGYGERIGERNAIRDSRIVSRRLGPDDAPAPTMRMNIQAGQRYGSPKAVTWNLELPVTADEAELAGRRSALENYILERSRRPRAPNEPHGVDVADKHTALERAQTDAAIAGGSVWNRKVALPAFRAARQALLDDIKARSPFEAWTPESGYAFWGLSPTHEKIYDRMVASVRHPDYFVQQAYDPELDRRIFYLRRRFPLRHEVAAGAGLGVAGYASDAGED